MTKLPNHVRSRIANSWVDGAGAPIDRTNPAAASDVVTTYRPVDINDAHDAVEAALAAQPSWDTTGLIARGALLASIAVELSKRAERIAEVMTAEHGKILPESRAEVAAAIETFTYHAASARNATGTEYPSSHPDERILTIRRPLGVVGVITPWNFPLQIPAWKIAPALLQGNTVVWKPASNTPGVAALLMESMVEAGLPPGVVNMLLGPGNIGSTLAKDSRVNGVAFTGSVPVGHSIRDIVCGRGAKLQLELGGHNPAIVMPDADVELAVASIVAGVTGSTGQKCTATRRIILVGDDHHGFIELLTTQISQLQLGDGFDSTTQIGPVVSEHAQKEILSAISQATTEGASVLAQSTVPESTGNYVPPTILAGGPELSIASEEVFGPVALILHVQTLDEAIELANATDFGLTASVFTSDERAVRRCITDIDAGLVKSNAPTTGSEFHAPFGGMKDSTFAGPREQNSDAAAAFFSHEKTVYLRLAPEHK